MTNLTPSRGVLRACGVAAMLAALAAPAAVRAQPLAGGDDMPAARPLPKYFDQLDLSDVQKDKVFKVLDLFNPLVASQAEMAKAVSQTGDLISMVSALRTLKALKAHRHDALLKVLTDDQRDKLKDLQTADSPVKP